MWVARGVVPAAFALVFVGIARMLPMLAWAAYAIGIAALVIESSLVRRSRRLAAGEGEAAAARQPSAARPLIGCVVMGVALLLLMLLGSPSTFCPGCRREGGSARVCLSNAKNIALAFQMYLEDNDGVFPPADNWCDTLGDYVKHEDVFRCPEASDLRCAYAYNRALSSMRASDIANPDAVVAVFESPRGWNGTVGREALPAEPRHFEGDNYGLASGSARWVKREDLAMGTAGIGWPVEPAK
jgi:hypothetical protein